MCSPIVARMRDSGRPCGATYGPSESVPPAPGRYGLSECRIGSEVPADGKYDYDQAPRAMSWRLVEGDIMKALDGTYVFEASTDGSTDMTYHLSIELIVPVLILSLAFNASTS